MGNTFGAVVSFLVILNSLFLSWWVFWGDGHQMAQRLEKTEQRLDSLIVREGYESDLGQEVIVNQAAAQAVQNLKPELEALQQARVEPTPIEAVLGITDETREYFIPMGSGMTTRTEWTDVSSLQATINGDRYGSIIAVYFEASMKAPNGVVEARLLDRTNSVVIHESNIENRGDYSWVISKPFAVASGGHTFMVQLKSSSGEIVEVNQARLRIVATEK